MKVPNCSGNSFVGGGDTFNEEASSSDYEEALSEVQHSSDGDLDSFSDFLWMENEEEFDDLIMQNLEEQELMNDCLEAMNEMALLDEIGAIEAEQINE